MKKEFHWLILFTLLLALSSLACGALQREAETISPEDRLREETAGQPQPGAPESEETIHLHQRLEALNSYRIETDLRFVDAGGTVQYGIVSETLRAAEPPGRSLKMQFSGVDEMPEGSSVQIIQLEDTAYTVLSGVGCVSGRNLELLPFDEPALELMNPGQLLGELRHLERLLPNQEINGVEARHYSFDAASINQGELSFTAVNGQLYLAEEGGYPVRIILEAQGQTDILGLSRQEQGALLLTFDLYDANQPITVSLPAECAVVGEGQPYPLAEDAFDLSTFEDLVTYKTNLSVTDVVALYQEGMPADGWTPTEQIILTETAILIFARGEEEATITISYDQVEEAVLVLIIVEAQQ